MGSQARFILLLALSSVWAFAGFAELGPRHGFGAVADLFGDIDAEILRRPTSPYRCRVSLSALPQLCKALG